MKSRLAQDHLVVWFFVTMSKMPRTQDNGPSDHFFQTKPDQEKRIIGPASLLQSRHCVLFLLFAKRQNCWNKTQHTWIMKKGVVPIVMVLIIMVTIFIIFAKMQRSWNKNTPYWWRKVMGLIGRKEPTILMVTIFFATKQRGNKIRCVHRDIHDADHIPVCQMCWLTR